jgi:ribosomal-protein-alanine N-acetyltransferase
MALIGSLSRFDTPPDLTGAKTRLRYPVAGDFAAWAELRGASRAFLAPWEPTWPHDDLTRPAFRRRLRRYARDVREDRAYPFFIFEAASGELAGGLTLSNVRRGVAQACSLGYWAGERFAGRGLVSDAVRAVLPFCFGPLGLHRVEAACLETNLPSQHVLAAAGFQPEGRARAYLRIDGQWRDHLLFAVLDEDRAASRGVNRIA